MGGDRGKVPLRGVSFNVSHPLGVLIIPFADGVVKAVAPNDSFGHEERIKDAVGARLGYAGPLSELIMVGRAPAG